MWLLVRPFTFICAIGKHKMGLVEVAIVFCGGTVVLAVTIAVSYLFLKKQNSS